MKGFLLTWPTPVRVAIKKKIIPVIGFKRTLSKLEGMWGAIPVLYLAVGAAIFAGFFVISRFNFLLFHGLAELFAIVVAWSVFLLVWNARRIARNDALVFLGTAYFFIGLIDLLHTLAYKGTGFLNDDVAANFATQLWIAARGLEALSLLIYPLLLERRLRTGLVLAGYAGITALMLASVLTWGVFPDCYIVGSGLTAFKIGAEYAICAVLAGAIILFARRRECLDTDVFRLMVWAMAITMAAELSFTLYASVYGIANVVGHFLKIMSFYLIYVALIRTAFIRPYTTLFYRLESEKQAVQESEKVKGAIIACSPLAIVSLDIDDNVLTWNRAAERMFGWRDGEAIGKPLPVVSVNAQAAFASLRESVLLKKESQSVEIVGHKKDGEPMHLSLSVAAIYDDKDHATGIMSVFQDTTERRQADAALRESEEKFRQLLEGLQEGIWVIDKEAVTTFVNHHMAMMLGYTAAEMVGKKVFEFMNAAGVKKTQCYLSRRQQGLRDQFVFEFKHKSGRPSHVVMYTSPLTDIHGHYIGAIAGVQDITEHKRTAEALRKSEEQFRAIVENAPEPIFIQTDMHFTYLNPKALALFGANEAQALLGTPVMERCHPDHRKAAQDSDPSNTAGTIETIYPFSEQKYLRLDGSSIWAEPTRQPIVYHGKKSELVFLRDISARKEAEKAQQLLQAQLVQAQKMESVGRLAGGVAHDYNNMLSVILGYTQLCMEQAVPGSQLHDDLHEILHAALRSKEITRQLLAFARKQTIAPEVLDLNDVVQSMLKMIGRLIGENIHLNWLPGKNLWPVKLDAAQIDQIMANLCVNARDAISGTGTITIETGNIIFDAEFCAHQVGFVPGAYVLLAISDNGSGMDAETLNNIFEPFFTTKDVHQGTGLRLPTVYGIVKQNNGFIDVSSQPGQGATFKIYLPRHEGDAARHLEICEAEFLGRGETVLFVEDEPMIMTLGKTMLDSLGYKVLALSSPRQAMQLAKEYADDIHMLITDVVMPEMNGRELSDQLGILYPELKTLFMSGYTADIIAHRGVLDQGTHFIQKPFAKNDLGAKMRAILG